MHLQRIQPAAFPVGCFSVEKHRERRTGLNIRGTSNRLFGHRCPNLAQQSFLFCLPNLFLAPSAISTPERVRKTRRSVLTAGIATRSTCGSPFAKRAEGGLFLGWKVASCLLPPVPLPCKRRQGTALHCSSSNPCNSLRQATAETTSVAKPLLVLLSPHSKRGIPITDSRNVIRINTLFSADNEYVTMNMDETNAIRCVASSN